MNEPKKPPDIDPIDRASQNILFEAAVKRALKKKRPAGGWPKAPKAKGSSKEEALLSRPALKRVHRRKT